MNKKAEDILTPEALKFVLAVVCLLLLIYLGYKLYGLFQDKHEMNQAGATLNAVVGKVKSLSKPGDNTVYSITSPRGWVLQAAPSGQIPKECENRCLCMIKSDKIQVCQSLDNPIVEIANNKININSPPVRVTFSFDGNIVKITT